MPLPPALTPEQRQAALEKAAVARRQRAEVKEKLKASSLTLAELFEQGDRDETLAKLKVVSARAPPEGVSPTVRSTCSATAASSSASVTRVDSSSGSTSTAT